MKRWFVMLLIGMTTAAIAAGVDICIDVLAGSKYSLVASCILKEQINSGGKVPGPTQGTIMSLGPLYEVFMFCF